MNCAAVARKLSSYIDNELSAGERQAVSEHITHCGRCAADIKQLEAQEVFLRQFRQVEPSSNFRARFWERVRNEQAAQTGRDAWWGNLAQRWIPVPIVCSLLIVVFSAFTALSPLLYALPQDSRGRALQLTKNTFAGFGEKNVFSPLNFVDFCDNCHTMLCESCQNEGSCPMIECGETTTSGKNTIEDASVKQTEVSREKEHLDSCGYGDSVRIAE
ncbi:MAG: hypothetical protein A2293_05620 [Elusimicrobia bacterium RIFOXYB2_FULL_49_7]|nr:MAG: hypothetical protein A2293_05620 [Elusimicrobia bacterium RIFOXYB2_FULL_49_7]